MRLQQIVKFYLFFWDLIKNVKKSFKRDKKETAIPTIGMCENICLNKGAVRTHISILILKKIAYLYYKIVANT